MILSTTHQIGGRSIRRTLGVISSQAYVGLSIYRSGNEPQPQLLAGGYPSFEVAMTSIRQQVTSDLMTKCEALNGDALVGLSFSYLSLDSGIILVCASATAVKLN